MSDIKSALSTINDRIKRITILVILVTVVTMAVRFPFFGKGYVSFGDAVIIVLGAMYGPITGALAGGFGAATADVIGGYRSFAIFSFLAKGLEGYIMGYGSFKYDKYPITILFSVIAGSAMVMAYFISLIFTEGYATAMDTLPLLLAQIGVCLMGGLAAVLIKGELG